MDIRITASAIVVTSAFAASAAAVSPYFQGFEDPGFTPGGDDWNNYDGGDVQRVASGYNGITSADGSGHAVISNLQTNNDVFGNPSLGALGPYTRFGGYSTDFGSGFSTSVDVYLDTSWTDGMGFDYSVAATKADGTGGVRDFIFHVGVVGGDLLVNGSNNTDYSFNAGKITSNNGGNNYEVASSGWYTFEHNFYELGGALAVDYNLYDSSDNLLYSVTRSNAGDLIGLVGGNRYGWFTYNNINELAFDNVALVPAPGVLSMLGVAGAAAARRRR